MLVAANYVLGSKVEGSNDRLGSVHDLLFDDRNWLLRFMAINTLSWLPGRKVVLPPLKISEIDWPGSSIKIDRTREEIGKSPNLADHEPVSRQRQTELVDYFDWPNLWGAADPLGPNTPMGIGADPNETLSRENDNPFATRIAGDPHLRSAKHIFGYTLEARNGEVGEVEDLILDDEDWRFRYLVARMDAAAWLPQPRFLVSPDWVEAIDWESRRLKLDLTRNEVEKCPEFSPTQPINRVYEERLYDYYGRPRYWQS